MFEVSRYRKVVIPQAMDTASKRPGSITFLLVGAIFITLFGTPLFLPFLPCPDYCFDTGNGDSPLCPTCAGLERISLWNKWRYRDNPDYPLSPQEEAMEGRVVSQIMFFGFQSAKIDEGRRVLGLRSGDRFTKRRMVNATCRLLKMSDFNRGGVEWGADPVEPNKIVISITNEPSKCDGKSQSPSEAPKLPELSPRVCLMKR